MCQRDVDGFHHLGPRCWRTCLKKDLTEDDVSTTGLHPDISTSLTCQALLTFHALS